MYSTFLGNRMIGLGYLFAFLGYLLALSCKSKENEETAIYVFCIFLLFGYQLLQSLLLYSYLKLIYFLPNYNKYDLLCT